MRREPTKSTRCRFGVAVRDITPPVGIYARAWGAATHDTADGVHRPLRATATMFAPLGGAGDEGDVPPLVLVALDLGWFMNPADEVWLRSLLRGGAGVADEAFLLTLSHAHSTAVTATHLAGRPGGDLAVRYLATLAETVTAAIEAARTDLAPAWIAWGEGVCTLARNRDYWDEEAAKFACGYNPTPESPPDSTLMVGRVTGDDGATRTTFFNYGCHPTTLAWENHLLSPDYIGAAREILETAFAAPAVFLHGADGELGPREGYVGDAAVADRNGRILGHAAASAIEALPPAGEIYAYRGIVVSGADLGVWRYDPASAEERHGADTLVAAIHTTDVPTRPYPPADALRARLAATETTDRATWEKTQRALMIREALGGSGDGDARTLPLWCWRLGDALLLAVPDEPYNSLQRDVRAAFPDAPVLVLSTTNGTLGYLCPRDTYGSGRYQAVQSPYLPGCLEQVTDAAIAGLRAVAGR